MYLPYEMLNEIFSYVNDIDIRIAFNKCFNLKKTIKTIKNKDKIEYLYKNRHISLSSYCLQNYVITSDINNLENLEERNNMENRVNMNDFVDIKVYDNPKTYMVVLMTFYILKSLDTLEKKISKSTYNTMDWVVFTVQYQY